MVYFGGELFRTVGLSLKEMRLTLLLSMLIIPADLMRKAFSRSWQRRKMCIRDRQNTFANRTLPDAVYVTIRGDQPVNLCGAFEKPVLASDEGFVEPSKRRLVEYAKEVYENYTGTPVQAFAIGAGLEELAPSMPLAQMLGALENAVCQHICGSEVE